MNETPKTCKKHQKPNQVDNTASLIPHGLRTGERISNESGAAHKKRLFSHNSKSKDPNPIKFEGGIAKQGWAEAKINAERPQETSSLAQIQDKNSAKNDSGGKELTPDLVEKKIKSENFEKIYSDNPFGIDLQKFTTINIIKGRKTLFHSNTERIGLATRKVLAIGEARGYVEERLKGGIEFIKDRKKYRDDVKNRRTALDMKKKSEKSSNIFYLILIQESYFDKSNFNLVVKDSNGYIFGMNRQLNCSNFRLISNYVIYFIGGLLLLSAMRRIEVKDGERLIPLEENQSVQKQKFTFVAGLLFMAALHLLLILDYAKLSRQGSIQLASVMSLILPFIFYTAWAVILARFNENGERRIGSLALVMITFIEILIALFFETCTFPKKFRNDNFPFVKLYGYGSFFNQFLKITRLLISWKFVRRIDAKIPFIVTVMPLVSFLLVAWLIKMFKAVKIFGCGPSKRRK